MQTALNLLTREGAIRVAFSPRLTPEQYAELILVIESPQSETRNELRKAIQAVATRWGSKVEIENLIQGNHNHGPPR
jgi:hypothetical protein